MDLPPGTRLGPYEILAPLGAGGTVETADRYPTALLTLKNGVASGPAQILLDDSVNAKYGFPGYLLYVNEQKLYFTNFDLSARRITG